MNDLKSPNELFSMSSQDVSLDNVIRKINNRIFKFQLNVRDSNDINMNDFKYIKKIN